MPARGSVRRVARSDNRASGFIPSLLAITGHCLAEEFHLPLETPARGARIQMQPQANPVPHRQWLVLRMREQATRLFAVYEVRKAFDDEHWRSMEILSRQVGRDAICRVKGTGGAPFSPGGR